MFYGMSCGRRKRNVRRLLHILLRACECARVWSVQKVRTEAGKQEIFHKRERQKKRKSAGMAEKTRQAASAKCERFRIKNRDDGKKTRRAPAQDWQKKMLREPKNTGMTNKKQQAASVKRKRFRIKIGMTGKNTTGACTRPAEKNTPGTPKYRNS